MEDLGPFSLANTHTHDFTAASNGQQYRAWVATPAKPVPGQLRPVLYTLDANWTYGMVVETARFLAFGGLIPPVIVVGIGYPGRSGDRDSMILRNYELTPSSDAAYLERAANHGQPTGPNGLGGADGFLSFIADELAPAVEGLYGADPADRALFGYSLGGLFAVYALLQERPTFARYIVGSPSLWWDDRMLFDVEERRAERSKSLPARVFVSAGEQEEVPGGDPPPWAQMVSNALQFSSRLASRKYEGLELDYQLIPQVGHQQTPMLVQGLRSIYRGHPGIVRPQGT
jgi:predicted alpha/beta superfamily hydrolase